MARKLLSLLDCIMVDKKGKFVLVGRLIYPQPCLSKGLQVTHHLLLSLHNGVVCMCMCEQGTGTRCLWSEAYLFHCGQHAIPSVAWPSWGCCIGQQGT